MPSEPLSLKLYRFLLKLYPAGFQEEYTRPMESEFGYELAESRGVLARARLWLWLLTDLVFTGDARVLASTILVHGARVTIGCTPADAWARKA